MIPARWKAAIISALGKRGVIVAVGMILIANLVWCEWEIVKQERANGFAACLRTVYP